MRWCRRQPQDRTSRHGPISKPCQISLYDPRLPGMSVATSLWIGKREMYKGKTDALLVTLIGLLSHAYHTLLPRRGLSSKPDIVEISIDPSRFLIQLGNPFCPRSDTTLTVSVPMLPADSGNLQRGLPLFPRGRTALCRFFPPLSHSLFFLPSSSFPQLDTAVFSGDPSEGRSGLHVLPSRCQLLVATCTSIARSGKGPYTCQ